MMRFCRHPWACRAGAGGRLRLAPADPAAHPQRPACPRHHGADRPLLLARPGSRPCGSGSRPADFEGRAELDHKVAAGEFERACGDLRAAGFGPRRIGAYLLVGLPGQSAGIDPAVHRPREASRRRARLDLLLAHSGHAAVAGRRAGRALSPRRRPDLHQQLRSPVPIRVRLGMAGRQPLQRHSEQSLTAVVVDTARGAIYTAAEKQKPAFGFSPPDHTQSQRTPAREV